MWSAALRIGFNLWLLASLLLGTRTLATATSAAEIAQGAWICCAMINIGASYNSSWIQRILNRFRWRTLECVSFVGFLICATWQVSLVSIEILEVGLADQQSVITLVSIIFWGVIMAVFSAGSGGLALRIFKSIPKVN